MQSLRNQRTLATTTAVEGFGYWSGRDVRVEFRPAPAAHGILFFRRDAEPPRAVPADVAHRIDASRRTVLANDQLQVEMVEHILAALAGLQIDNCAVWVDAAEMPGCDGSSLPFVDALDRAGTIELAATRPSRVVDRLVRVGNKQHWIEARPASSPGLTIEYHLDYPRVRAIGCQTFRIGLTPDTFRRELAPSRTFMLKEEADQLLARGIGTRVTPGDLLIFGSVGPLGNELRFRDECVRHKTLDLVGDLALAQCDVTAHLVAYRSGHQLNAELVQELTAATNTEDGFRRCA